MPTPLCAQLLQIDVNVKGVAYGTRAAANAMLLGSGGGGAGGGGGGGHIINFSSIGGVATFSGVTMYACSKCVRLDAVWR